MRQAHEYKNDYSLSCAQWQVHISKINTLVTVRVPPAVAYFCSSVCELFGFRPSLRPPTPCMYLIGFIVVVVTPAPAANYSNKWLFNFLHHVFYVLKKLCTNSRSIFRVDKKKDYNFKNFEFANGFSQRIAQIKTYKK